MATEQPRHPRPGRQHQALRPVSPARAPHLDPARNGIPSFDRLIEPELDPAGPRQVKGRLDASFRIEDAGPHFVQADGLLVRAKSGESPAEVGGAEHLVGQAVCFRTQPRARDQGRAGGAEHEAAGDGQQPTAGLPLELGPALVGAEHQGDVQRVLEVRLPDDPRTPVRGPLGVGRPESVERQHALASPRQLGGGLAAHASQPHDDHVGFPDSHDEPVSGQRLVCPGDPVMRLSFVP